MLFFVPARKRTRIETQVLVSGVIIIQFTMRVTYLPSNSHFCTYITLTSINELIGRAYE